MYKKQSCVSRIPFIQYRKDSMWRIKLKFSIKNYNKGSYYCRKKKSKSIAKTNIFKYVKLK